MELILALSIVLLVAIPIVLLLVFRRISRKNRTFFCEITITLCQETFVVESQYSKSEVKWDMVQKLARTRKHIFIYLSQESALIIPRRVFEGTTQWNEFYGICKQKISRTA
ncbi:MAG: YcxB family protein [bacterium]